MFQDLLSLTYNSLSQRLHDLYRHRALDLLPETRGCTVLDLACGTGQNFPILEEMVGDKGRVIGVDASWGMLRQARAWVRRRNVENITLLRMAADELSPTVLKNGTGYSAVDIITCSFGFSMMKDWEIAFHRSFSVLRPGGFYLIQDVYAEKWGMSKMVVEKATGARVSRQTWTLLEKICPDFQLEYLEPKSFWMGGRVFIAYGTKRDSQGPTITRVE